MTLSAPGFDGGWGIDILHEGKMSDWEKNRVWHSSHHKKNLTKSSSRGDVNSHQVT